MNKSMLKYAILTALTLLPITAAKAADLFDELDSATVEDNQDLQAEFAQYKAQHEKEAAEYIQKFNEEFAQFKKINAEETAKFQSRVAKVWDKPEMSSAKVWVEYSKDMSTKNSVDFEKGVIQIATTSEQHQSVSKQALRTQLKALLTKNQAQAFQDDEVAQAVEKKTKSSLTLVESAEVKPTPILMPLVADKKNPSDSEVDKIVDTLIQHKTEKVETNKSGQKVVIVQIPLDTDQPSNVPDEKPRKSKVMADLRVNKMPKGAREVAPNVSVYAKKVGVDETLVFAIIETESAFNPMAKSPVPAYGLMQIVPSSAGADATEKLFGQPRILSPSYLYASEKNIEVGTAYINILQTRYLKKIEDPLSRLYCSIAAYNTGAGNVAKAFTGNFKIHQAVPIINKMTPQQVYDYLIKNLPYEETRHYLERVVSRMPKYSA